MTITDNFNINYSRSKNLVHCHTRVYGEGAETISTK